MRGWLLRLRDLVRLLITGHAGRVWRVDLRRRAPLRRRLGGVVFQFLKLLIELFYFGFNLLKRRLWTQSVRTGVPMRSVGTRIDLGGA